MNDEPQRSAHQSADVDQTNEQKVDQANTQDASHHSDTRQDLDITSRVTQAEEQQVTVVVQNHLSAPLPGSGNLAGRVLDSAGSGVNGCLVSLFFGPLAGVPVAVEQTDSLGRFRVNDLPPGFYSLRAKAPDDSTVEHWNLRLDAGSECRPQVVLPVPQNAGPWPDPAPAGRRGGRAPRRRSQATFGVDGGDGVSAGS